MSKLVLLIIFLFCSSTTSSQSKLKDNINQDTTIVNLSPLEENATKNIEIFAKLYGYIRFFHPTKAVAVAKWDNIAINGIRTITNISNIDSLSRELEDFFKPIAPTLRVFRTEIPEQLPPYF